MNTTTLNAASATDFATLAEALCKEGIKTIKQENYQRRKGIIIYVNGSDTAGIRSLCKENEMCLLQATPEMTYSQLEDLSRLPGKYVVVCTGDKPCAPKNDTILNVSGPGFYDPERSSIIPYWYFIDVHDFHKLAPRTSEELMRKAPKPTLVPVVQASYC